MITYKHACTYEYLNSKKLYLAFMDSVDTCMLEDGNREIGLPLGLQFPLQSQAFQVARLDQFCNQDP